MVKSKSFGARVFVVVNALVIGLLAASCLIPLIHVFAISCQISPLPPADWLRCGR